MENVNTCKDYRNIKKKFVMDCASKFVRVSFSSSQSCGGKRTSHFSYVWRL